MCFRIIIRDNLSEFDRKWGNLRLEWSKILYQKKIKYFNLQFFARFLYAKDENSCLKKTPKVIFRGNGRK